ncbi:tyrosine-type recombinase/integrase [Ochrovirga pacifica]|uniref:tyrosine-type recombinase/integrase n=1 Tax=Ochrovirga pacifica TaxID=1042376 RepID=UPI0002E3DF1B|nr:tyrosine-type recombinase/integrase [Ochrovirga pacifica]
MELLQKFIDYLSLEKKNSSHTVTAYQKDIKDFLVYIRNTALVDCLEVDKDVVRSWVVFLKKKQLSNRSINRKLSSLKAFYKFLQKIEELHQNPVEQQKSLNEEKKVMIPFSEQEIEAALTLEVKGLSEFEKYRNKMMIHLLYASGIRQAELIGLRIEDLELSNKTIKVTGKRNKQRMIPLYDAVVEELVCYLKLRSQIDTKDSSLFVTKRGAKLYSSLVYRIINLYFSETSTKQVKSPHVLRHAYATTLVNNGADLNSVKELLGHSSLAATQVYTHNSLEKLKQVYNQAHPRNATKK